MLRLIFGRAGSGKSRLCLEEISNKLKETSSSFPLIYLIPEQASFQAEYALATASPPGGSIRAQVFSFKRLAWKVMQETGEKQHLFIDDTGKSMLMLRILEEKKRKLQLFKHAGEQPGTVVSLVRLYNEMKRYCLTSSHLRHILQQKEAGMPLLLRDKLTDLSLIMEEMEQEMEGHYLDGEGTLGVLSRKIADSEYLRQAEIWVDGFYNFTRLEEQVLGKLIQESKGVTITFCLERDYPPEEKLPLTSPFYSAALACRRLTEEAYGCGLSVEKIFLPGKRATRFTGNVVLQHLEKNIHRFPTNPFSARKNAGKDFPLILATAQNRRVEVEAAARKIIHLARECGYRWREMVILVSNLEEYSSLLTTVLRDYEIPYFLDQERSASFHPLLELIRSSMEVITRGWRYDGVFRCIKTGFLFPRPQKGNVEQEWRRKAARLENYVLAFGIQGNRWLDEKPWSYTFRDTLEEDFADQKESTRAEEKALREIDETRRFLAAPLAVFQAEFKKAAGVKEKTSALFYFLESVSVVERLESWSKEDLEKGDLEKSREHIQVYNGIINLMEQLVELMGEMEISSAQFARILETGLDNLSLSLVPPSLDQIMVGNIARTRPGDVRCAFILGANDGILPSRLQDEGIFTEEERQNLENVGLELAPGVGRRLLEQQFLLYMALTRASSLLWISYPRSDEEGRALMPALLIARLKDLFPSLKEQFLQIEPEENPDLRQGEKETEEGEILSFLVHPRQTLSLLTVQLSRWKEGREIHPLWWDIYNWYASEEKWREEGLRLLKGIFYRNKETPLAQDVSRRLYGEQWKASVSRLEKYRACPFSQFLSYGLRLSERKLYRLESLDIGRFFHMALRNVTVSFQEKQIEFEDLDEKTCLDLVEEEVNQLVPKLQKEILLSSNRYIYLASRLKKTVGLAVLKMVEHYRRSRFRPLGVELSFGAESDIPTLEFSLENGGRVEMVGRIDRVDLARDEEGKAYLRVIDYKSGLVNLSIPEIFYGLSLQLLTYLDILLTTSPQWLKEAAFPAGIFYFRIYAPFINAQGKLTGDELAGELLKCYRMQGHCLAEPEVVRLMDNCLTKGYSPVLPVGLSKEGSLYKNSAVLSAEQFAALRKHVRFILRETAEDIFRGIVEIRPFKFGKKRACTYCRYKAVCQFDSCSEENAFHLLPDLDEKDIWQLLQRGYAHEK